MRIKGKDIYVYGNILKQYVSNTLPTKVALSIAYNTVILEPLYKVVEQTRVNVLNEYGEKNEDGSLKINPSTNAVMMNSENLAQANQKISEIFLEEFEINEFKKIKYDDFMETKEIKPSDIINLKFMIED